MSVIYTHGDECSVTIGFFITLSTASINYLCQPSECHWLVPGTFDHNGDSVL